MNNIYFFGAWPKFWRILEKQKSSSVSPAAPWLQERLGVVVVEQSWLVSLLPPSLAAQDVWGFAKLLLSMPSNEMRRLVCVCFVFLFLYQKGKWGDSRYGSSNCKSPPPSRHLLKLQGLPDLTPAWFAFVKTWLIHSLLQQLLTFTINLLHVMSRSRPLNVPQRVPVNHSLLVGNSATFWRNSCWILLFRFWQMEEFE